MCRCLWQMGLYIYGRKSEWFGSMLVTLHYASDGAVRKTKWGTQNNNATINFIQSTSSLQHCLFHMLLSEMSEHHDLLLHNDVRWLSKGKALGQLCDNREEIGDFLHRSKQKKTSNLNHVSWTMSVCFLRDFRKWKSMWNYKAETKLLLNLMCVFHVKLDLVTIPSLNYECYDRFHCNIESKLCCPQKWWVLPETQFIVATESDLSTKVVVPYYWRGEIHT